MEPIISIYDLLMKRHRQQKKDGFLSPRENIQSRRLIDAVQSNVERSSDAKKPRWRNSPARTENKGVPASRITNNVVTATHLTQKSSVNGLATNKKEAIEQYMGRLATRKQKTVGTATMSSNPTETTNSSSTALPKKLKPTVRLKPKGNKTMRSSGSNNSRKRVILSPRNTNRLANSSIKRDKSAKTKTGNESKAQGTPKIVNGMRPKMRLEKSISKISNLSKLGPTSSVENVTRYRF